MDDKRKNLERKIIIMLYDYIDACEFKDIDVSETKRRLHNIVDVAIINYENTITM
jgi:hypothetical protein